MFGNKKKKVLPCFISTSTVFAEPLVEYVHPCDLPKMHGKNEYIYNYLTCIKINNKLKIFYKLL